MNKTESMMQLWEEGRTRLTGQLPKVTEEDLLKRLHPNSNSIGFLLRHIGEVEHLFAKNVFHLPIEVKALTLGTGKDKGQFTNLYGLLEFLEQAKIHLRTIFSQQKEEDWDSKVTTKEFGTKTKQQALARILTHTTYHAGQIGIILKYGNKYD